MSHPSLDTLVEIAVAAGATIMPFYDDAAPHRDKADGSPVTAADEAAEALILSRLADAGVTAVIAEESVAAGRIPDVGDDFYLVDPLDGTREFISRNGEFTVNIARIEGGRAVAGVVYAPAIGSLFAGDASGAWRAASADGPREAIHVATPTGALRAVASRSHLTDETRAFIDRFDVASFVSSGSSLKFCRVAEGAADIYPRLGRTMEWDTAAGHAVLTAAGGRVLTMDGAELSYGKQSGDRFANPHFVAVGTFDPFTVTA